MTAGFGLKFCYLFEKAKFEASWWMSVYKCPAGGTLILRAIGDMKEATIKSDVSSGSFLKSPEGLKFSLIDELGGSIAGALAGGIAGGIALGPHGLLLGAAPLGGIVLSRLGHALLFEREKISAAIKYSREMVLILEEAVRDEYKNSVPVGKSLTREIDNRRTKLEEIGVRIDRTEGSKLRDEDIVFCLQLESIKQLCRRLAEIEKITVKVPAIHPSAVAALLFMDDLISKYCNRNSTIEIYFDYGIGIQLLGACNSLAPSDFVFIADSAFYRWEDRDIQINYHPVLPVSFTIDYLLGRATTGDPNCRRLVLYQPGTSAQDIATLVTKKGLVREVKALSSQTVRIEQTARELDSTEAVAVVAPYVTKLLNDQALNLIQIGNPSWAPSSLYAARKWFTPSLETHRNAFANLFLFSWQKLRGNQNNAIRILLRNKKFLSVFGHYFC